MCRISTLRRPLALLIYSFALRLVMIAFLLITALLGKHGFVTIQRLTLFSIGLAPVAFLAGLLDARLTRSAVADLFIALRAHPAPADLRDALAKALRDPSLSLVIWLLHAELRARLDELHQSRARVIEAGQSEHKRLERNLHDGAQQRLVAPVGRAGAAGAAGRVGPRGGCPAGARP